MVTCALAECPRPPKHTGTFAAEPTLAVTPSTPETRAETEFRGENPVRNPRPSIGQQPNWARGSTKGTKPASRIARRACSALVTHHAIVRATETGRANAATLS